MYTVYTMGILEDIEQYIKKDALIDLSLLKTELAKKIPGVFNPQLANRPMMGGYSKRRKIGGATPPNLNKVTVNKMTANKVTANKVASNKVTANKMAANKVTANKVVNRQGALTKKNAPVQKKRSFIELQKMITLFFLSILVLETFTTLNKVLPQGMTLVQVLTLFGNEAYTRIILPFSAMVSSTFSFLVTTTLPNVRDGIYLKLLVTLNGTDTLTDANRTFTTLGNIAKVSSWMTDFFSKVKNSVYPKEAEIKDGAKVKDNEVEPMLRDILKNLEDVLKRVPKYTYMKIPGESILMTINK